MTDMIKASGALTCARYAFSPNFYLYCGPDTDGEFGEYLQHEAKDDRLIEHLTNFEVMYPYLKAIAEANNISDPFDPTVVEAYWLGNSLLDKVDEKQMYAALMEKQKLPRKVPKKELKWLLPKIDKRARLHHSFHVFNVFTRTGHHTVKHTVDTMDQCRIGWGKIVGDDQKQVTDNRQQGSVVVESQKLVYTEGALRFENTARKLIVPSDLMGRRLSPGDWVSFHWGFVADVISEEQLKELKRFTFYHLELANETL